MQYKAGAPLVSSLLKGLIEGEASRKEDGGCRKYIIDDSDAVGGWESDEVFHSFYAFLLHCSLLVRPYRV
jgi:hypothetical protein